MADPLQQGGPGPLSAEASLRDDVDFSTRIPGYSRPERACNYCQAWHLECFVIVRHGQKSCSPCNALSRTCSFSQPQGDRASPDRLTKAGPDATSTESSHPQDLKNQTKMPQSAKRTNPRLPVAAVRILESWVKDHLHHPYPSEEERAELQAKTGLRSSQILNWLANVRRRKYKDKIPKPAHGSALSSPPVDIPANKSWASLNPFERWQNSPPESEPAPLEAIVDAVEKLSETASTASFPASQEDVQPAGTWSPWKAPSSTSSRTESAVSSESDASAWSAMSGDSHNSSDSLSSMNSASSIKKARRRRRRLVQRLGTDTTSSQKRRFQCTFCTDRFKSKYDWVRHEKTLHISLERWTCLLTGREIHDPISEQRICAFCEEPSPSQEHFDKHNTAECEEKGPRLFYRKDHLQQHLRLAHNGCRITKYIEKSWKSEHTKIKSRCGFCNQHFTTWQDRVYHLAKEFRAGAEMKNWKGPRGFDPEVEAHLTFAMPPYLIEIDSKSPIPFSASNPASVIHHNEFLPRSIPLVDPENSAPPGDGGLEDAYDGNYWNIFPMRLAQFARQKMLEGIPLSDELLQSEGRIMVFGNDDPWNQTEADHPEWLQLFREKYGIPAPEPNVTRDISQPSGQSFSPSNPVAPQHPWSAWPSNQFVPSIDGKLEMESSAFMDWLDQLECDPLPAPSSDMNIPEHPKLSGVSLHSSCAQNMPNTSATPTEYSGGPATPQDGYNPSTTVPELSMPEWDSFLYHELPFTG